MANNITTQKLINELEDAVKSGQKLKKVMEDMKSVIVDSAAVLKGGFKGIDKSSSKGIIEHSKNIEHVNNLTEDQEKLIKDLIKVENKLLKSEEKLAKEKQKTIKLTDEEIKEKLKLQKVNKQKRKDLEAELILEEKSINNKNEIRERIKALRIETDKLDFGDTNLKKFNDEIDELTDKLSDNSDQFIKNKINIGNYKSATEGLTESFDDQKKRLKILTDTYHDAVSEGKKNTKEAKALKKALDNQKDAIDDVTDATKKQEKASKSASAASKAIGTAIIITIIAKLTDSFGTSREATLAASKAMSQLTERVRVLFATLVNSFEGVKIIFTALTQSVTSMSNSLDVASLKMKRFILEALDVNPLADYTTEIGKVNDAILALNTSIEEGEKNNVTFSEGWDTLTKAFDGFIDRMSKAVEFNGVFLELQQKTEISIQRQTRALAGLAEKRQILQDISDDDTLGFITRALAVEKAQKAAIDFADKEVELAKTKELLTIQAIKGELLRSGTFTLAQLNEIKTGEDLNRKLKEKGVALKVSDDNEAAFTEAFVERVEKQTEALSFNRDQEEKNRKTFRDSFEQRNDILTEFGELQIAKNQAIIDSDKSSFEERNAALAKNKQLEKQLFEQSIDLIIKQGKLSIDLNKDLSTTEKEVAKAKLDKTLITALANETDLQEIFNKIRLLDLGEIEEKVLKETLKLKKEINKENKESEESVGESNRENFELQKEKALQEIALEGTTTEKLEELDESRFEQEKQNLEDRIAGLKKDSNERLALEIELNNLLLDENQRKLQEEADAKKEQEDDDLKADKKRADARQKLLKDTAKLADELLSKSRDKEGNLIEKELDALDSRINDVRSAIDSGNTEAQSSLAELEAQKVQVEARKEELRKKEIRDETIIAGLQVLASNNGDVGKSLGDISLLIAGLSSIQGFIEGTENVGNSMSGHKVHNGEDGYIARFDGEERIMTGSQNGRMGGMSNEDVADLVHMHNHGGINGGATVIQSNNKELVDSVNRMEKAIKSIPIQNYNYDANGKYHEQVIQSQNKKERIKVRANNIYK